MMPVSHAKVSVLPLEVLCRQVVAKQRSEEEDFKFLKESVTLQNTPDYSGYNTKVRRNKSNKKRKTNIFYKPLIDKKPTDPSTILTAMYEIERTSKDAGQEVAVFTCDQQLYRIVVDIVWANPGRWASFYPRLGGMHWLMSFIGSVGKLMGRSTN